MRSGTHRRPRAAAGSALLETLVSIIVFSFGLLGMAGLQTTALRNSREARMQATGVRLAVELAERMRGNPGVATQRAAAANPYLQDQVVAVPPRAAVDCMAADCATPALVAAWDAAEWMGRVFAPGGGLPGARVAVCFDEAPFDADGLPVWPCTGTGDVVRIKLGWTRAGTDRTRSDDAAFDRVGDAASRPSVSLPVVPGADS